MTANDRARFNTYKPPGFHTLNAYLFVASPESQIAFLENAFDAKELNRTVNKANGEIANCILQIGDSCLMVSQARGEFENMRTALYVYVDNVDFVYQRALRHGATKCFAPMAMDYGDYQGGIIGPHGNYWWISKRQATEPYNT